MEQSNNFNNPGGGKGPKMPRFNMNWLYTIILIALIALFFSGGGDALGGSAAKEATYFLHCLLCESMIGLCLPYS